MAQCFVFMCMLKMNVMSRFKDYLNFPKFGEMVKLQSVVSHLKDFSKVHMPMNA